MSGLRRSARLAGLAESAEIGRPSPARRAASSQPAQHLTPITTTWRAVSRRPKKPVRRAASPISPFLSLPAEVRLMIYRHLLCLGEPIASHYWGLSLSSQILRTCRLVLNEARPVLYGENIWEITIKVGLFYSNFLDLENDLILEDSFARRVVDMRKFYIRVHLMAGDLDLRPAVRAAFQLSEFLSTLPSLCSLYIEFLADDDSYYTTKFHSIIEIFGLLRNVPIVVIDGIRSEHAKYLVEKMTGSTPVDNLPKMYYELDSYAQHFPSDLSADLILRALEAMEGGNVDKFKEIRALTVEAINQHVANASAHLYDHDASP